MYEHESAVRHITNMIASGEIIRAEDIGQFVERSIGCGVNCYPGNPHSGCHQVAFFISLTSKRNSVGRGHLSFRKALESLVQHMFGHCPGITREAILICDSWDPEAIDDWSSTLENIKQNARLEAYLISGRNITPMRI